MDITLERILSLLAKKENGEFIRGEKAKFASSLGLPHNVVAEWINGKSKSYRNHLYHISDKYNVSVEWLKGETDIKEKSPAEAGDLDAESNALVDKLDYDQLVELIFKATKRAEELKKAQQKLGE